MLSATVSQGKDVYFWKTMPRSRPGPPTGLPSTRISPVSGWSRPAIMRSSVDFPQPDGPSRTLNSPLQFLNKWGCDVTAFTSNAKKADEARRMGAHHVIDTHSAEELKKAAGSFDFVISTVNADLDWNAYIGALAPKGRLHVVGVAPNPLPVPAFSLLVAQRSVSGSPSGSPAAVARMLEFAARHGVAPVVEEFSMSQAKQALAPPEAGKARSRIVLKNDLE